MGKEGENDMTEYEKTVALWQEKSITNDAELAEALHAQCISFAYNSGKIENDKITFFDTREIFDHDGVSSYTGDLRTLFEIQNARKAYEFFLVSFQEKRAFDESLIKGFHKELTQGTFDDRRWKRGERPGEYKKNDYVVGKMEVGAYPEDVQSEMKELLEELKDIPNDKALLSAAYFHAVFETIHPFADGNGRCGRLAMNYFLVLHNHPPITIHEVDRMGYYSSLEAWDSREELDPLVVFLQEQAVKTWRIQLDRAERRKEKHMKTVDYTQMHN